MRRLAQSLTVATPVLPLTDCTVTPRFVLPNPTYGAWESVLFGDEWSKPHEPRRQEKIDALKVE